MYVPSPSLSLFFHALRVRCFSCGWMHWNALDRHATTISSSPGVFLFCYQIEHPTKVVRKKNRTEREKRFRSGIYFRIGALSNRAGWCFDFFCCSMMRGRREEKHLLKKKLDGWDIFPILWFSRKRVESEERMHCLLVQVVDWDVPVNTMWSTSGPTQQQYNPPAV